MKLTPAERLVCRVVAMRVEPPTYEVVLIPGESPPEWEECDPYCIAGDEDYPIQTEIRVTVGVSYILKLRARVAQSRKETIK